MIHATNLTKFYGSHCAVNNISFSVPRGEILGLLGPNGAGKSTTMRMITGFLRASSGTIAIAGEDIAENEVESKRRIGYLPELAPIYPDTMVYDYLCYVARIRGVGRADIGGELRRVVGLCGLGDVMHQAFRELSRGYRQRVGLAHAIVGDPDILILDEPTSGLDPNQIVEIRSLIKNIGRDKTVIFSTHVLSEAEATCDRIVIIHKGRIVADSTPGALRRSLQGGNVLQLVIEGAQAGAVVAAIRGIGGVAEVTDLTTAEDRETGVIRARVVCDEEARRAVYRRVRSEPWILLELTVERQSMEDAFRELTEHAQVKGKIDGR